MEISKYLESGKQLCTNGLKEVKDHDSTLYTIGAVVGVVATSGTAIEGTLKAKKIFDENDGKIDKKTALAIAKCYIKFGVAATGTVACILLAHHSDAAKYAALAALHASDSKKLDEFIEKNKPKKADEKQEKNVRDVTNEPSPDTKERFFDEYMGKFVNTSIKELEDAKDRVNDELHANETVYASEFYEDMDDDISAAGVLDGKKWWPDDGPLTLRIVDDSDGNYKHFYKYSFSRDPETEMEHSLG